MTLIDDSPNMEESPYGPCPGAVLLVAGEGEHRFAIVEGGTPTGTVPLPETLRRGPRGSAGLFGMGRDASTGAITFDGRELRTATRRSMDPQLFAEIEAASAKIASEYRARRVRVNVPGGPGGRWLLTVHPSGGACLASGPDKGVVDHTGQVFGNPGLYVADASVLPRAPGLPPAMTIAALSERQAVLLSESASSTVLASRPG